MSAVKKLDFSCESYWSFFEEELQKVKKGIVTELTLKSKLVEVEVKFDELAEESEFFDKEKAQTLLGWSEAILQDLHGYREEVKHDLLAAISYFVNEEDAILDTDPLGGLDDDYDIMKRILQYHSINLI